MSETIGDMAEENLLEPKTYRSNTEIGREIRQLLREHDEIQVAQGKNEYDIKITTISESD